MPVVITVFAPTKNTFCMGC